MPTTLRVAMIGAGSHATNVHYPSLAQLEDVEIAAVAELSEERMKKVREQYGIAAGYPDYRTMIEREAPDAVYLVMPPQHLFPHAAACLEMGVNLFIEKPPGMNTEQTRHLARLAEKKGGLTMVGFQRRYAPLVVRALDEARARGGLDLAVCSFYKHYLQPTAYYGGAVDILTSDAIHAVDLLRYLGGTVKRVASDVKNRHADYPNSFVSLITFESGATGVLLGNWMSGHRFFTCELHAKGMSAFVDLENRSRTFLDGQPEERCVSAEEAAGGAGIFQRGGFLEQNRVFMDAIRRKKPPANSLADSIKTMELVDEIYRSGR